MAEDNPITNNVNLTQSKWNVTELPMSTGGGEYGKEAGGLEADDAAWIVTNSFIIFTMQTGFGLLESGCVNKKNEVNIMVKNVVDIVLGGFTYWLFGYGLSFGDGPYTNVFCGVGKFALDATPDRWGTEFTSFFFQLSFATTATTIVSGAMAERCNFIAYCLYSLFNTLVYCIPAGWLWGNHGFLKRMGAVDIAGSGGIHLVGGVSALVSAAMLKPRTGRYDNGTASQPIGDPITAILGLFILWWGWLSFNCGSVFGITGNKWKYVGRASAITICGSFGGGFVGMFLSYFQKNKIFDVSYLINGVLAALVSITAGCALYHPWEAIIIGIVGAILALAGVPLVDYFRVDDPVGAVAVHGFGGLWGLLAIGLFADADTQYDSLTHGRAGVFKKGGFELFGIQLLAAVCLASWSAVSSFSLLYIINLIVPIRMTIEEELLGADFLEHGVLRDPEILLMAQRLEEWKKLGKEFTAQDVYLITNTTKNIPIEEKEEIPPKYVYTVTSNGNGNVRSRTPSAAGQTNSVAPASGKEHRTAWS